MSTVTIYSLDLLLSDLNQSIAPGPVLTVTSCPEYRFLRSDLVIFYSHLFKNISVCCDPHKERFQCSQWSKTRCFFLEFPCIFYDPAYLDNLISGNSAFSKSCLYIWDFLIHILLILAPRILSIILLGCEMSVIVQYFEHSLVLPFFGIGMKTDFFQSCGHCWVFQIWWHIECSTFLMHHLFGFEVAQLEFYHLH